MKKTREQIEKENVTLATKNEVLAKQESEVRNQLSLILDAGYGPRETLNHGERKPIILTWLQIAAEIGKLKINSRDKILQEVVSDLKEQVLVIQEKINAENTTPKP